MLISKGNMIMTSLSDQLLMMRMNSQFLVKLLPCILYHNHVF